MDVCVCVCRWRCWRQVHLKWCWFISPACLTAKATRCSSSTAASFNARPAPLYVRHSAGLVLVLESSFVRLWLVHREIESMFKSVRCLFRRQVHRLNSYLAMVAFSCDQIGPGCHLKHCHNRYFLKCKSMLTVMMQHQWLHLRGNVRGIMFPFRFRRGNAVPLIYRPLWVHAGVTVNHAFCINCNLKWSVL